MCWGVGCRGKNGNFLVTKKKQNLSFPPSHLPTFPPSHLPTHPYTHPITPITNSLRGFKGNVNSSDQFIIRGLPNNANFLLCDVAPIYRSVHVLVGIPTLTRTPCPKPCLTLYCQASNMPSDDDFGPPRPKADSDDDFGPPRPPVAKGQSISCLLHHFF